MARPRTASHRRSRTWTVERRLRGGAVLVEDLAGDHALIGIEDIERASEGVARVRGALVHELLP